MKNKHTARLCVLMCLVLIISTFAACSIKKDGDSTTTSPINNQVQESWIADSVYEPVTITNVELVELVSQALGEDASGFNGDLSTLTPEQLEKVEDLAADKGLIIEKDESGNTVIKKEEAVTTQVSPEEYSQLMNQVSVKDPNNLTPEEYEELSKVANENGMAVVTKPDTSEVVVVKPVTTTKKVTVPVVTQAPNVVRPTNAPRTTSVYKPPVYNPPVDPIGTTAAAVSTLSSGWVNTYGGNANQVLVDSEVDGDDVISVGITYENAEGKTTENSNAIITKSNSKGKTLWSKVIGGDANTSFENVTVLSDGSILAVGYTSAENVTGATAADYKCPGTVEALMVKFSGDGDRIWTKIIGGSASDMFYSVQATADGGFLVGGKSESTDADMKDLGTSMIRKAILYKCDANGGIQWRQALSGSKHNAVQDIEVTSGGNIYAAIECISGDGEFADIEGTQTSKKTTVVLKLDPNGNIIWRKAIYESGNANFQAMVVAPDGGVVLAGEYSAKAAGNNGTFTGNYNGGTPGTFDGGIVKFNADGTSAWATPIVGFESDFITGLVKIDGGYAVAGYTSSTNRDFTVSNKGNYDTFIYTFNEYGSKKNVYSLGGTYSDTARGLCSDGSNAVYLCGSTNSGDGYFANCDVKGNENLTAGFVCRFELAQG